MKKYTPTELQALVEQEFMKHPNNEMLYADTDLSIAYKAGVWDGIVSHGQGSNREAEMNKLTDIVNKQREELGMLFKQLTQARAHITELESMNIKTGEKLSERTEALKKIKCVCDKIILDPMQSLQTISKIILNENL